MVNQKRSGERPDIGGNGPVPAAGWTQTLGSRRLPRLFGSLVLFLLPAGGILRAADAPGRAPDLVALPLQAISARRYLAVSDIAARPSFRLQPETPVSSAQLVSPAGAASPGRLTCSYTCGATHGGTFSPLGFAHWRLMANGGTSGSTPEPARTAVADPNAPPAPGQGLIAGGSNQQIQANSNGFLTGIPGSSVNFTTGALILSPASGQDATPLALIPSVSSPTADVFQVYQTGATPSNTCATNAQCAFAVQSNGNLFFAGNNATYGASSQTTQSWLRLYGSVSGSTNVAPPYFQFLSGTGSSQTNLFSSISQNGILCAGSSVPGGDCGAGQQITLNPMTAAGDLVYGGSTVLGTAQPKRLAIGSVGQCLQVLTGPALGYGSCGSGGGGTVTSVGLSMPAGFTVTASPVTSSGTLNVAGPLTTEGDLPYYHSSAWARLGVGASGQCLTSNGADPVWGPCGSGSGSGTVTSVGLSLPNIFSLSGTPVTTSGTLSASLASQSANLFFAGPSSGSAAAPAFRRLAPADAGMTTEGDLLYNRSSALTRLGVGASGQCLTSNGTDPSWGSCGGSGSVTSVGISLPGQFQVSQSPVTSSGMLTGVWATLGTQVTGDPNFPGMPSLLQRRTTLLLPAGGGSFTGVGDSISGTVSLTAPSPSASFPDPRLAVNTGTTAKTAAGFSGNSIYRTGLSTNGSAGLFFDARADVNGATVSSSYHTFLGLTDQAVATTMAGTSNDCKYKGIYAAISACTDGAYTSPPPNAPTHWVCVTNNADGNATSQSATDSGAAFDGNEHRFAIWEDIVNAKWHFYIDGSEVCGTGVAANYPSATNLKVEYGALNTTTTAITLGAAGFQVFSN
jgi:hypothetical protein